MPNYIIDTGLPDYYDKDAQMLYACMKILVQYVEDECRGVEALDEWTNDILENPNSERQVKQQREMATIYRWWIERGSDYAETPQDDEMLSRLVAIRGALWV